MLCHWQARASNGWSDIEWRRFLSHSQYHTLFSSHLSSFQLLSIISFSMELILTCGRDQNYWNPLEWEKTDRQTRPSPLKLFALSCMSILLTIQGACPAALCETTSFRTILPTPDIVNLASTNLISEKRNLINFSLIKSEVEHYIGHTLSAYLYLLASLVYRALRFLLCLRCGSNQGTSHMPVRVLPRAKQLPAQECRVHLGCPCGQAYQLYDSSCH